jgi:hypothetical protein
VSLSIPPHPEMRLLEGSTKEQFIQNWLEKREKVIGCMIERLSKKDREQFLNLANDYQSDGLGVLVGIERTNCE